ncbi:galectin-6-like [Anopheles coustani]|uniref:galectin-6-like n=1 Tax=Anopheles coustani TaxID=139045 RepID=UPI00265B410A|nr:galectin-6-like [Anopheles coustani]
MSSILFTAKFPRPPKNGDEILIRGKLRENARKFSVNFCLPRPAGVSDQQSPTYIAYHFKTIYDDDGTSTVVQNWKNVIWDKEDIGDNIWHTDRSKVFTVIFRLHEDKIKVFADRIDHLPDYQFPLRLSLDGISTIELWDDVDVEEISFRYDNKPFD